MRENTTSLNTSIFTETFQTQDCVFGRTCIEPASVSPHEWPDDITKWPVSIASSISLYERTIVLAAVAPQYFVCPNIDMYYRSAPNIILGNTPICLISTVLSPAGPVASALKGGENSCYYSLLTNDQY